MFQEAPWGRLVGRDAELRISSAVKLSAAARVAHQGVRRTEETGLSLEFQRARGENDPAAWHAVLAEFGPYHLYEVARTRWRLAEALA